MLSVSGVVVEAAEMSAPASFISLSIVSNLLSESSLQESTKRVPSFSFKIQTMISKGGVQKKGYFNLHASLFSFTTVLNSIGRVQLKHRMGPNGLKLLPQN